MQTSQQTETGHATPEQLLKLLDAQLAAQRNKRAVRPRNRATLLVTATVFIIVAAGIALVVAQQMALQLHPEGGRPAGNAAMGEVHGNF
ncbi:MAG: hypothetical protein QOE70_1903 [Chthoniobacter sp.]|jgi:hypothetical protein|nr:hypothetical protein [Chthoniobacter sp.]